MPIPPLPIAIPPKVSVAGAGGKSSLIEAMAATVSGNKIISTTTHIRAGQGKEFKGDNREELVSYFEKNPGAKVYVGEAAPGNKLSAPKLQSDELAELCDYLFIEADGSKGLPFKAHRSFEPQEPAGFFKIYVIGASALGHPLSEVCHCYELVCERLKVSSSSTLSTQLAFEALTWELERQIISPDLICINQIDLCEERHTKELLSLLEKSSYQIPVCLTCLKA